MFLSNWCTRTYSYQSICLCNCYCFVRHGIHLFVLDIFQIQLERADLRYFLSAVVFNNQRNSDFIPKYRIHEKTTVSLIITFYHFGIVPTYYLCTLYLPSIQPISIAMLYLCSLQNNLFQIGSIPKQNLSGVSGFIILFHCLCRYWSNWEIDITDNSWVAEK